MNSFHNNFTKSGKVKAHIKRDVRGPLGMIPLEPVSVSTYGTGATFTSRDSKGKAVSVYIPQEILDAIGKAQDAVASNPAKAWHCEPVTLD